MIDLLKNIQKPLILDHLSQPPADSTPEYPEYRKLWADAWKLADWIDDADSEIPWQERTKYVPEVLAMGIEIDRLKAQQNQLQKPVTKNPAPTDEEVFNITQITQNTQNRNEHISPRMVKEKAINTCPAKDKKTYLCYGQTYFTGKPTEHPRGQCSPKNCEYKEFLAG